MEQSTQGDGISVELHRVSVAGAWLVGGSNSPLFDADLVRTALQHRLRIPFPDKAHSVGCVRSSSTAVCPCAGRRDLRHVLRRANSSPARSQTVFHIEPAMTDLLTSGERHGSRSPDFAVASCLHPATRNPTPTQNLVEYENLKRTFHDTANRCQRNGLRLMDMQEAGRTQLATWAPGSLTDSVPPLSAHHATLNLELAQRISSSLCHDSARAILRRVRLAATRDALPSLGSNDLAPAWDDPGSDECTELWPWRKRYHDDEELHSLSAPSSASLLCPR